MTKKEHECVESQRWVEDQVSGSPFHTPVMFLLCESPLKVFVLPTCWGEGVIKQVENCFGQ